MSGYRDRPDFSGPATYKAKATMLVLLCAYLLPVSQSEWLVRNQPKIARFFKPVTFDFSRNILEGEAAPFRISMPEAEVMGSAASAGLTRENCDNHSRIESVGLDSSPTFCFAYPLTGTFWLVWTQHGSIIGVRIYTTLNLEI